MRVLVTGGAGFIGSNLALALEERGAEVSVLDNYLTGNDANLKGFKGERIRGDAADYPLAKLGRFDAIFHQAAITDTTEMDEQKMMRANVESHQNVLRVAAREGVHVVYASSAAVYGKGPSPMRESQVLSPANVYGVSKMKMDEMTEKFRKDQPQVHVVGLRYFNVFGPREDYKGSATSMVTKLADKMQAGNRPRIFKYGEQKRDFVYVKDVIQANLLALEAPKSGIVNIGTGRATTFNEVIQILNKVLSASFEPDYFDNPYSFYQNETEADLTLAKQLINYQPEFTTETGIQDYLGTFSDAAPIRL